jgi:hypothetical protein
MGIVFALVGLVLIVTGAQDTYVALGDQLRTDFTGPKNFTYWFAALVMVGALGAIPALHTFSRTFMALILLALLLSNKGAFAQFSAALAKGPVAPKASGTPAPSAAGKPSSPDGDLLGKLTTDYLTKPFFDFFSTPATGK